MKLRSSTGKPLTSGKTGTTSPAKAAKAYSDTAASRPISDTTTIMGIPETELTPKVRDAILTLMGEVDTLRRSLDNMKKRLSATEELADQDALLPIFNRRAFVRELTRVQAHIERYNGEASLVYIDLDRFKQVNDTYGHLAGDHALLEFSKRLISSIRETDVLGRLGGDEFGLILSNTNQDAAAIMTDRLPSELKNNPITWNGADLNIGMSYGIVSLEPGRDIQHTMAMADDEMYLVKKKSKETQ